VVNELETGVICFICVFGGALLGLALRRALPDHHLSSESKDAVKVGMGLVATMSALVLGLLVASAKSSYDSQANELTDLSARIVTLDRVLAHYGPEAKDARTVLKSAIQRAIGRIWAEEEPGPSRMQPPGAAFDTLVDRIQALEPKTEAQRTLRDEALHMALAGGQTRWLMYEQSAAGASLPLVVILICWLTMIFGSFGLFAPSNGTVITSFFVSALSVSVAILLILEMYTPYTGIVKLSSGPLRAALLVLGQ
jgi:hypothetical protein